MRWQTYPIVIGLTIGLAMCSISAEPEAKEKPAAAPTKPKVTIGKETTYVTEPLRPDGYPDYVAALNERMSKGVAPQNNAAVLLQQAFGPSEIPEKNRANFFKLLGIEPLSASGEYFVSRSEMVNRWRANHPAANPDEADDLDKQFDEAAGQPWKTSDHPIVAQWLAINEKPLGLIVEASRRPKQYFPITLGEKDPLLACPLPQDTQIREAAVALAARAMQKIADGKNSDAWQDLQTCHRLARLTATGSLAIDTLVGYAVEGVAVTGDAALFHAAKVPRSELVKMQDDLRNLPQFRDVALTFDIGERFVFLDVVEREARDAISAFGVPKKDMGARIAKAIGQSNVDWNVPMRMGNEWFDRLTKISRIEDRFERAKAMEVYNEDLHQLSTKAKNTEQAILDFATKGSLTNVLSPRIGALNVSLLMPALSNLRVAYNRTELFGQMDRTACALALYRADHRGYPETLTELTPKYLDKLPEDTHTREGSAPIRYRREGKAYVLWSVGLDGIDDNGQTYGDDPPGDDLVLRPVPLKHAGDK